MSFNFDDNGMDDYEFKIINDGQTTDNVKFNQKYKYYGTLPTDTWIETFTPAIGDAINFTNVSSNSGLATYESKDYTQTGKTMSQKGNLNKAVGKTNIKKQKAKKERKQRKAIDSVFDDTLSGNVKIKSTRGAKRKAKERKSKRKSDIDEFAWLDEVSAPVSPPVRAPRTPRAPKPKAKPKAKAQPKEKFKITWISALKKWNGEQGGAWCLPRKGSNAYDEVMDIRRGY